MIQQEIGRVTGVSMFDPLPAFYRLDLTAPGLAAKMRPGQFLLAETGTDYVRYPFFPITLADESLSLLLPPGNPLRRVGPGDGLDCLGPLGKGFPLPDAARNLLLLARADGFGVVAHQHGVTFLLSFVDRALAAGRQIVLVQEAPTAGQLYPPTGLPPGVEVHLATADGSRAHAGGARELLPDLAQWADQVYAVGAPEWYREIRYALQEHRLHVTEGLAWGLIAPEVFPCGMGVCGGCAVETRKGYRQPCVDGPVFDLTKV